MIIVHSNFIGLVLYLPTVYRIDIGCVESDKGLMSEKATRCTEYSDDGILKLYKNHIAYFFTSNLACNSYQGLLCWVWW